MQQEQRPAPHHQQELEEEPRDERDEPQNTHLERDRSPTFSQFSSSQEELEPELEPPPETELTVASVPKDLYRHSFVQPPANPGFRLPATSSATTGPWRWATVDDWHPHLARNEAIHPGQQGGPKSSKPTKTRPSSSIRRSSRPAGKIIFVNIPSDPPAEPDRASGAEVPCGGSLVQGYLGRARGVLPAGRENESRRPQSDRDHQARSTRGQEIQWGAETLHGHDRPRERGAQDHQGCRSEVEQRLGVGTNPQLHLHQDVQERVEALRGWQPGHPPLAHASERLAAYAGLEVSTGVRAEADSGQHLGHERSHTASWQSERCWTGASSSREILPEERAAEQRSQERSQQQASPGIASSSGRPRCEDGSGSGRPRRSAGTQEPEDPGARLMKLATTPRARAMIPGLMAADLNTLRQHLEMRGLSTTGARLQLLRRIVPAL